MSADVDAVVAALQGSTYVWRDEVELQGLLAEVLCAAGFTVAREVTIAAGCRVDLLVGRVGIEVKVKGAMVRVARQLQRYAGSERLDALVLATTRSVHRAVPASLGGMPVTVAHLAGPIF